MDATGPLTKDGALLYRLNFGYTDSDSFRNLVDHRRVSVSPSLTWRLTDRTEFRLNAQYENESLVDDYGVPVIGNRPASVPISRFFGASDQRTYRDRKLIETMALHRLNEAWNIRFQLLYSDADFSYRELYPLGLQANNRTLDLGTYFGKELFNTVTTNVTVNGRFNWFGSEHRLLFGGEWYRWRFDNPSFNAGFAAAASIGPAPGPAEDIPRSDP